MAPNIPLPEVPASSRTLLEPVPERSAVAAAAVTVDDDVVVPGTYP